MPNCATCCDVPNGKDIYNPKCQDCLTNELAYIISSNIHALMQHMEYIYEQLDDIKDLQANLGTPNIDINLIPNKINELRSYLRNLLPNEFCLYDSLDEVLDSSRIRSKEAKRNLSLTEKSDLTK